MSHAKSLTLGIVVLLLFGAAGLSSSSARGETDEEVVSEGPPEVKDFKVGMIEPKDEAEFEMGKEISLKYEVENTGEEEDTQEIELTVLDEDEQMVHEDGSEVTLQPSVTIEMVTTWTPDDPGNYKIRVSCENNSEELGVNVVVEDEAYFGVEIISYDEEVVEGHEVVFEYMIENRGTEEETQDIVFDIYDEDGRAIFNKSERIRLSPDDNFTGEFTWQTEENKTGVFDVVLASEDDQEEMNVTVLKGSYFEVSIYEFDKEIIEGEKISVTYRIDNTGEVGDEQDIRFLVDGEVVENETGVELGIDGIYAGKFTWNTEEGEVGEYELKVASDNEEAEFIVNVLMDASFKVEIIDYISEVKQGETMVVEYRITNVGDVEGEQSIEFLIDGEVQDIRNVTLDGGQDFEGEFSWSTDDAGEYDFGISSEDGEEVVTVTVKEEKDDGTPGFTIGALLLGGVAAVWIFYRENASRD